MTSTFSERKGLIENASAFTTQSLPLFQFLIFDYYFPKKKRKKRIPNRRITNDKMFEKEERTS